MASILIFAAVAAAVVVVSVVVFAFALVVWGRVSLSVVFGPPLAVATAVFVAVAAVAGTVDELPNYF